MYNRVLSAFFSPTGTTRNITCHIAAELAKTLVLPHEQRDFTLQAARAEPLAFGGGDIVVFGVPVYAGRVPNVLLKYLNQTRGGGAAAIPVVLYGNRDYDDALVELYRILRDASLRAIAAAAFVGEHAFSVTLAAGRPDEADLADATSFATRVADALRREPIPTPPVCWDDAPLRSYYQPRGADGAAIDIRKVRPRCGEACTSCGLCARVCPMGAIDLNDPRRFQNICIKCGACVKSCPTGARYYDDADYLYHKRDLERSYTRRAAPMCFLWE